MSKSLVIVESPAKAKTIRKYLGRDFAVEASSGHLIDLPSGALGVDVDKDFQPKYVVIKDKKKYLSQLQKAAKGVENVYLASDPDREGEAIAWHIADRLKIKDNAYRILIHEITKNAVLDAIKNPIRISQDRFEAQQARRVLDRLVGYRLSPILWKKVKRGLSAGRVQSVALRIVVEREREIEAFKQEEYWTIEAALKRPEDTEAQSFIATLSRYDGKKIEIENQTLASEIVAELKNSPYKVISVEKKDRIRNPAPPFITSTIQQEASRKLRFTVKKTMSIAQKLYEGIELGKEGPVGLITYMRTDSVRVSDHAVAEARAYAAENYGPEFVPETPNVFKVKKSAQDAHEAIRPTFVAKTPDSLRHFLSDDEFELYKLVWQRFLSSQMSPAVYDQTTAEIEAGRGGFRSTGSTLKFAGFTAAYMEVKEEEEEARDREEDRRLPDLTDGMTLALLNLEGKQHFTQPPPRFTESSLVKELEEKGIGRPSTYAAILSTIQEREYVIREKTRLKPTLLGRSVSDLLVEGFPEIMDVKFTAEMEDGLDKVEEGNVNWVELLKGFYKDFSSRLEKADDSLKSLKRDGVPTEVKCDLCGAMMIIKWGKKGEFLSCSSYPECKNAKQFEYGDGGEIKIKERKEPEVRSDILCDLCARPMALRMSRYGKFLGCTGYPECKGIKRVKEIDGRLEVITEEKSQKRQAGKKLNEPNKAAAEG
ncbi:MAG: type I DNA topoisomerase [Deltaproteobacteria bacterium]